MCTETFFDTWNKNTLIKAFISTMFRLRPHWKSYNCTTDLTEQEKNCKRPRCLYKITCSLWVSYLKRPCTCWKEILVSVMVTVRSFCPCAAQIITRKLKKYSIKTSTCWVSKTLQSPVILHNIFYTLLPPDWRLKEYKALFPFTLCLNDVTALFLYMFVDIFIYTVCTMYIYEVQVVCCHVHNNHSELIGNENLESQSNFV